MSALPPCRLLPEHTHLHPNAVLTIKIDGKVVAFDVLRQTLFFVFCYFGIAALIAFLLTWIEQDIVIGVTASISAIGDIGPGFGTTIGPMGNYSSLHSISKFLYISLSTHSTYSLMSIRPFRS